MCGKPVAGFISKWLKDHTVRSMTTITTAGEKMNSSWYQNVHLALKSFHYNSSFLRHSGTGQGIEAEKAELTYSGSEGAISLFTASFY